MFAQVDIEGNQHVRFKDIVDHRYDGTEVQNQDVFIITHTRTKHQRETKKVVEALVQWKDGRTTCENLNDINN